MISEPLRGPRPRQEPPLSIDDWRAVHDGHRQGDAPLGAQAVAADVGEGIGERRRARDRLLGLPQRPGLLGEAGIRELALEVSEPRQVACVAHGEPRPGRRLQRVALRLRDGARYGGTSASGPPAGSAALDWIIDFREIALRQRQVRS